MIIQDYVQSYIWWGENIVEGYVRMQNIEKYGEQKNLQ